MPPRLLHVDAIHPLYMLRCHCTTTDPIFPCGRFHYPLRWFDPSAAACLEKSAFSRAGRPTTWDNRLSRAVKLYHLHGKKNEQKKLNRKIHIGSSSSLSSPVSNPTQAAAPERVARLSQSQSQSYHFSSEETATSRSTVRWNAKFAKP